MLVKRIAAYTHLSSTVYERIAKYWSEIATFFHTPLHLTPPVGGVPIRIPGKHLVLRKLESPGSEDSLTIG